MSYSLDRNMGLPMLISSPHHSIIIIWNHLLDLGVAIFIRLKPDITGVVIADSIACLRYLKHSRSRRTGQPLAHLGRMALVGLADVSLEVLVILVERLTVDDHPGNVLVGRLQSVSLSSILERELVAAFALVAVGDRLGIEVELPEAGFPLPLLVVHHQVLHAVDEAEMHSQIRPCIDGASLHGVQEALLASMLARDGVVGADDVGVAVGDEAEVDGVDDPVLEDPGEVVDDEPRAVRAQRLVVEREWHLLPRRRRRRAPRQ